MNKGYTFEDLKDEDVLVEFLKKVWRAGLLTGRTTQLGYDDIVNKFMPDFKARLKSGK